MFLIRKHSSTSNIIRAMLRNSSTGAGLTGLTEASSGLIIATITDNEATTTRYRADSSEIQTIAALGTFAAPSDGKCRFKAVDGTNHPGLYEFQFSDARYSVSSAKVLRISVSGATNLLTKDLTIQLDPVPSNVTHVSDDSTAADTLELFAEALDQSTGQIDSGTFAAGAVNAAAVAADAAEEIAEAVATHATVAGIKQDTTSIKAKTDNLPSDPADQSAVEAAITAAVTSIKGADGDTLKTLSDQIDGLGGGDATLANQELLLDGQDEILAAIQGTPVIQTPSPNVSGNLVLTQGDTYDGVGNPKAQWTVSTDYTDGWTVTLTIRDDDDEVIYSTAGEVVSSTVVAVEIEAPTGLTMEGCPGQWQGKFDVQLTKNGSVQTIALGVCYINEDQSR